MTLYAVGDDSNPIMGVPHQAQFDAWKAELSDAEIAAVHNAFDGLIRQAGKDVITSSWLPKELSPMAARIGTARGLLCYGTNAAGIVGCNQAGASACSFGST